MVLQAHLKKHIIALGGWLLMYTSGPPPGLAKDHLFAGFFWLPSLRPKLTFVSFFLFFCAPSPEQLLAQMYLAAPAAEE